jgi:hypothetical protein
MGHRSWLERVAGELAGQGLPAAVRARLLDELRDHLDDLTEGGTTVATEAQVMERMGEPGELAATAVAEYRRAGWVRRHPVLVFGFAPVPAALVAMVGYVLVAGGIGYVVTAAGYGDEGPNALSRDTLNRIASGFAVTLGFVPFLVAAVWFGWLAVRSRVSGWWLAAAIAQVAILGGAATTQLIPSDLAGQSQLVVGLGIPLSGWRQAAQLLIPVAIGWIALRAANRRAAAIA